MLGTEIVANCQAKCNLLAAVFAAGECKQFDRYGPRSRASIVSPSGQNVTQSGAVSHSRPFGQGLATAQCLRSALTTHAKRACRELMERGSERHGALAVDIRTVAVVGARIMGDACDDGFQITA